MKVYLAGPMRGLPEFNFPAFNAAAARLREIGYTVFNPAEKGYEKEISEFPDLQESLAFRRKVFALDMEYIALEADIVVLLPGWEKSKGACAEKALAEAIGLDILEYQHVFDTKPYQP